MSDDQKKATTNDCVPHFSTSCRKENNMYYTGIGSRETPPVMLDRMRVLAQDLAEAGYTLRSGGANGADAAFAEGCSRVNGRSEIYLPWAGFNGVRDGIVPTTWGPAMTLAQQFHPAWDRCSFGAQKLHARNGFQVLGLDLVTPSRFVICWTRGGLGGGGTGQAIRIARSENIPVYDLAVHNPVAVLAEILKGAVK